MTTAVERVDLDSVRDPSLPPFNHDAECAVIGSVLKNPRCIIEVADLIEPRDFYDSRHQAIWKAILELDAEEKPVDYHLISDKLQQHGTYESTGGLLYLSDINLQTPSASHIAHYGQIVLRTSTLRRMISLAQNLAEAAYRDEKTPEAIMAELERRMTRMAMRAADDDGMDMDGAVDHYLSELVDKHERAKAHDWTKGDLMAGWPTGIRDLDSLLLGLKAGDLIYLAARTSVGKSIVAQQIAMNVARAGGLVYYASLEMNRSKLMDRSLTMLTGVPRVELQRGNLTQQEYERIQKAAGLIRGIPMRWDTSSRTTAQIRRKAERWADRRGQPLALIVVDYVQLLQDKVSERSSRYENLGFASHSLKALAEKMNVAVFSPAQVSREVLKRSNKMPDLSDLRESGDLEQDADVVIGLDREDYHDREAASHTAQMQILKARDSGPDRGRGNLIELAWVSQFEFYGDLIGEDKARRRPQPMHDDAVAAGSDLPWPEHIVAPEEAPEKAQEGFTW